MKFSRAQALILLLLSLDLSECNAYGQKPRDDARNVTVTTVQPKDVTITHPYVCRISWHHHIEVRAPAEGYLEAIRIGEGQAVKRDDVLFQVKLRADKEKPDADDEETILPILAPFDGMVDSLPYHRIHSLVKKGETLATLFDDSAMWAYFNVPEARYLEYKSANLEQHKDELKIELVLANGKKFDQPGTLGAIGAVFKAGSVHFRADFPNPEHLLRHGQTATVLVSQVQKDAIVIPQRAAFEVANKRYVYVIDKDDVARKREIVIQTKLEDMFVVKTGVGMGDKIVTNGVKLVRDGDKVKY